MPAKNRLVVKSLKQNQQSIILKSGASYFWGSNGAVSAMNKASCFDKRKKTTLTIAAIAGKNAAGLPKTHTPKKKEIVTTPKKDSASKRTDASKVSSSPKKS
jgi:hypothetical protein